MCPRLSCSSRCCAQQIQASQRLDLNLEKGRIRDELLTQNNKTSQTENRLDKEMCASRASLLEKEWHRVTPSLTQAAQNEHADDA